VELSGDRLAFVRALARYDELIVRSKGAADARVVARSFAGLGDFDLDGDRLAWRERRCLDSAVYVADPASESAPPMLHCRAHLGRGPLRLAKDRTITAKVTCPEGCDGQLFVVAPSWLNAAKAFRIAPAASAAVSLKLSKADATRARKRRRLKVEFFVAGTFQTRYTTRTVLTR